MKELKINVLAVKQPIGTFYIASMPYHEVAQIATADVRRMEARDMEKYLGIQRPLNEERVKQLQQYVQTVDATFPTGVILAIDEKCASLNKNTGELTISEFIDFENPEANITFDKIAKIIDGQHRIASFVEFEKSGQKKLILTHTANFDINVCIFIGADISQQATIFSTVNLAQTKVNRSLAYDLADLANFRSPQKTCHMIAVMLDSRSDSPLYERIKRLGVKTVGRNTIEPLTQAVFVEALMKFISSNPMKDRDDLQRDKKLPKSNDVASSKLPFRNLFIDDKDEDIAFIVYEYFHAIKMKWPESWNDLETKGNILPRSNAFKAFMKFLHYIYQKNIGKILNRCDFILLFQNSSLIDTQIISDQFPHGSGGESMFYKKLVEDLPQNGVK